MSWDEFKLAANWFILGAVSGYFWHPMWAIIKKIIHEAKVAKHEWRKPNNKDS